MSYYVVSAKKATTVGHAVTAELTAPNQFNLVVGKTNRLEIFCVGAEGLRPLIEVPLFGRLATLNVFRGKGEDVDSLLIVTTKLQLAVVCWDPSKGEMRTRASGNITDKVGRQSDTGIITSIHPNGLIAVRAYDHSIKLIQWEEGAELKAFQVRLEDTCVADIAFVSSDGDNRGRHVKTVEVLIDDKDMKTLFIQSNIETAATTVIPIPSPYGGSVILGKETILYTKEEKSYLSVAPPHMDHTHFTCFTPIDPNFHRILIADNSGKLYMLLLDVEGTSIVDLRLEYLGETSVASCLVYLDNGVVYVGSSFGDSQLIRLTPQPVEPNSFIQVLENHSNIGPIRDMAVIESDGLTHVITCSGAFKDGSLRIIRNGIGIEEAASVDLPGVTGLFSLAIDSQLDNFLVVSLAHETHLLKISGEELEDTQLAGLETDECTLWCGMVDKLVLQVTPSGVRIVKGEQLMMNWKPEKGRPPIGLVSVHDRQIVLATGAHVYYLEVKGDELIVVNEVEMRDEVSAIDISPIDDSLPSSLVVLGLWREMNVVLLSIPDLKEVCRQDLCSDVVARAVQLVRFEKIVYVLAAMGDGTLYYFVFDESEKVLRDKKKATLGTHPTCLYSFHSGGTRNVFASSDRPAVIYSSAGKLVFSNVNLKLVTHICSLNSETFRECLVMSDGESLVIGRIDDIQKLHIRTVCLGESVARVAYQSETGTVGLITHREEVSNRMSCSRLASTITTSKATTSKDEGISIDGEQYSIVVLDANTFEILHSHTLKANEQALSIHSTSLGDDPTSYYIVGTAFVHPEEAEPKMGRLLVFESQVGEQRTQLRLVHEKETKGSVFSLATLGTKLVAAVNNSVRLFEWSGKELKLECSHFNYTCALHIKTKGDMLLVGDLMRSLCLVNYKSMESALEEVARDCNPRWITACEIIDYDNFIAAETNFHIFSSEKDTASLGGEEKQRLQESGVFYLGEMINVFRAGSLVAATCRENVSIAVNHSILFGTVEGGIGNVLQIEPAYYKFFLEVEAAVAEKTGNCMRCEHSAYRAMNIDRYSSAKVGFVDGDLVEGLLDLPRHKALEIVDGIKVPGQESPNGEEVLKLVEEMSRLH